MVTDSEPGKQVENQIWEKNFWNRVRFWNKGVTKCQIFSWKKNRSFAFELKTFPSVYVWKEIFLRKSYLLFIFLKKVTFRTNNCIWKITFLHNLLSRSINFFSFRAFLKSMIVKQIVSIKTRNLKGNFFVNFSLKWKLYNVSVFKQKFYNVSDFISTFSRDLSHWIELVWEVSDFKSIWLAGCQVLLRSSN